MLLETDLVRERKTFAMDAKDLAAVKEKIAERILFPQVNAGHLKLFSVTSNTDITTLEDLKEKDKLQVTVAAEFMPDVSSPTPTTSSPAQPEVTPQATAEATAEAAQTETEVAPVAAAPTHGKRNLLLILLETDIIGSNTKLKADGVTTLDELKMRG